MRSGRLVVIVCALALCFALAPLLWMVSAATSPAYAASFVSADDTPTALPTDATTTTATSTPTAIPQPSGAIGPSTIVAPAGPSAAGIIVATTMGCVMGIGGITLASMTLSRLLRGGYGPFLRTIVFGAKADTGVAGQKSPDKGGRRGVSRALNARGGGRDELYDAYDGVGGADAGDLRRRGASRGAPRRGEQGSRRQGRSRRDRG